MITVRDPRGNRCLLARGLCRKFQLAEACDQIVGLEMKILTLTDF